MARWLVIIRRDRPALYRPLQERIRGTEIIVDRRIGDRRRRTTPTETERRRGDRRRIRPLSEYDHWSSFGFRMVCLDR